MKSSLSKWLLIALLLAGCTKPLHMSTLNPFSPPPEKPAPIMETPLPEPVKGEIPAATPSVKVALLLPLSGDSVTVGNAMLDAATMALSDSYLVVPSDQIHSQLILLPKDTGNSPAEAARSAQQAIDQGAQVIIGPLFSQSVAVVAPIAHAHNVDVISFSNTKSAASNGVFVFGFLPEQQVARIADYAYLHNYQRIAVLAPNDVYGQKVKATLSQVLSQKGGVVAPIELYASSPANIQAAVARLAAVYSNQTDDRRFQAIFIADGGYNLKNILEAIEKNHIDLKKIKLLGTGQWDDPDIAKIPDMAGAWYPSAPPGPYDLFEKHFIATYGYKPVRLASLAYDAITLVATLSMPTPGTGITTAMLTSPSGFQGSANGLFRLHADGTSERALAVMEITPDGPKVIDPAPLSFPEASPTAAAPPSTPSAPAGH